jgi:CubicO group peptidase (beta-lactamase class C family)
MAIPIRLCLALLLVLTSAPGGAASLDDVGELEAFFDGAANAFLEAEDASGMTVSVVKNGRVLLAKGYGLATRETGAPVDAEHTLFRIGSVSKIFLATAIMQLVERGKLDLDTDLNQYLEGVQIPATFPEPITLRHVMTHTTGFEDSIRDLFVLPSAQRPLRDTLAGHLPARVRPVGELVAYSNHATALAGLAVEQVSGEPYQDYLDRHILSPLGMNHTSARQPLPEDLAGYASTGARPADYFTHVGIPPAGSISSTAADMAKFMIAHLQLGRLDDTRILREETAGRMQEQLFALDPRVNGLAHQWFENEVGGVRMIGHGGGMVIHITSMGIVPEHGVGFFASINTRSSAPGDLQRMFMERYFPATRPERPQRMEGASELERFTGWYSESRGGVRHLSKIGALLSMKKATVGEAGRLRFMDGEWVETEPLLFREVDGPGWLVFQEDESRGVSRALRGLGGFSVLLKEPWWRGLDFHRAMAALIVLLLLWPLLHRPLWRARRWWQTVRAGGTAATARWLAAVLRLAALVFLVGFGLGSLTLARSLGAEPAPGMLAAAAIPFIVAPVALAAAWYCVRLWREKESTLRSRVGYTGLVLGALLLVWWAEYWNVLLTRI